MRRTKSPRFHACMYAGRWAAGLLSFSVWLVLSSSVIDFYASTMSYFSLFIYSGWLALRVQWAPLGSQGMVSDLLDVLSMRGPKKMIIHGACWHWHSMRYWWQAFVALSDKTVENWDSRSCRDWRGVREVHWITVVSRRSLQNMATIKHHLIMRYLTRSTRKLLTLQLCISTISMFIVTDNGEQSD